jgi:peptidoglycan/LPS O-acetylase OafA/YrhL
MKTNGKKSFLARIPSWALALLTLIGATILMFVIGEGLVPHMKIKGEIGDAISYILYGIIIAVCCYFIVKKNPKSFWYVLLICNAFVIIAAIAEPGFWISTSMWIPMCGGLVLSIITSIIGARRGRRTAISDKPLTKSAGIPSWVLAVFTLFGATIVMKLIGDGFFLKINRNIAETISYILYGIIIAVCCYFIVKKNPKSFWYVLLICNAVVIIIAIAGPDFWITTSKWIPMCGGLVLSIITSIIGARMGRRKAISENP